MCPFKFIMLLCSPVENNIKKPLWLYSHSVTSPTSKRDHWVVINFSFFPAYISPSPSPHQCSRSLLHIPKGIRTPVWWTLVQNMLQKHAGGNILIKTYEKCMDLWVGCICSLKVSLRSQPKVHSKQKEPGSIYLYKLLIQLVVYEFASYCFYSYLFSRLPSVITENWLYYVCNINIIIRLNTLPQIG